MGSLAHMGLERAILRGLLGVTFAAGAAFAQERAADAPPASPPAAPRSADAPSAEVLQRWVAQLGADRWEDREHATLRLMEAGAAATQLLEAAAESPDPEVRFRAQFVLGTDLRRIDGYLTILEDGSRRGADGARAQEELVALGARAVGPLVDAARYALASGQRTRFTVALQALTRIKDPGALPGLASLLENGSARGDLGQLARALLACCPEDAPERLVDALRPLATHRQIAVRKVVLDLSMHLRDHPAALALASALLTDDAPELRQQAVRVVGTVARDAEEARRLVPLLADPARGVQAEALAFLGQRGVKDALAPARAILYAQPRASDDIRLPAAIACVAALGDREAIPALLEIVGSGVDKLVIAAVQGLGELRAEQAVDALLGFLDDERPSPVDAAALQALAAIRSPMALPSVVAYIGRSERFVMNAVDCLGALTALLAPGAGDATGEGADDDPAARDVAASALQALVELFESADGVVASAALRALIAAKHDPTLARAALAGVSKSAAEIRATSAQLLGRLKPEGALPALAALAAKADESYSVHYRVLEALGELRGAEAEAAVAPLLDNPRLRRDAARALCRMGKPDALSAEIDADLARLEEAPPGADGRNTLGIDLTYVGRFEEAAKQFELMLEDRPGDSIALYNLGCVAALAGQPDRAVEYLERSFESGYQDWQHMELDHDLDSLRALPRYQALLQSMRDAQRGLGRGGPARLRSFEFDGEPRLREAMLEDAFGVGGGVPGVRVRVIGGDGVIELDSLEFEPPIESIGKEDESGEDP